MILHGFFFNLINFLTLNTILRCVKIKKYACKFVKTFTIHILVFKTIIIEREQTPHSNFFSIS